VCFFKFITYLRADTGYFPQVPRNLEGIILLLKLVSATKNSTQCEKPKCAIETYKHSMQKYALFSRRFNDCVEEQPGLVKYYEFHFVCVCLCVCFCLFVCLCGCVCVCVCDEHSQSRSICGWGS
jgi:hypothetical protein